MKLLIAGGVGEHGRNCFHVQNEYVSFLVDCGLMAGEEGGGYPHLTRDIIANLDYVFLTHSHADHSGAYPWLVDNGFQGTLIGTKATLAQLPFSVQKAIALEDKTSLHHLKVTYGKSGHCLGSVWYRFESEGKTILFSGDYTEHTQVYRCDKLVSQQADVAILDCAYRNDATTYEMYVDLFLYQIAHLKQYYPTLLLPVPKYGRGLELYALLKKHFPTLTIMGDAHFISQLKSMTKEDYKELLSQDILLYDNKQHADIVFVSDPQLRTLASQKIAREVLKEGYALMTGTVETGTMSDYYIQEGKMKVVRYPVHLNKQEYDQLLSNNQFKHSIAYHCPFIDSCKEIEF